MIDEVAGQALINNAHEFIGEVQIRASTDCNYRYWLEIVDKYLSQNEEHIKKCTEALVKEEDWEHLTDLHYWHGKAAAIVRNGRFVLYMLASGWRYHPPDHDYTQN